MRSVVLTIVAAHIAFFTGGLVGDERSAAQNEVTRLKREYGDVLALQGTAKSEILVIAKILRAQPRIAVDQTAASGEYCFNSGQGTMIHFATMPENTAEDVVYEFDASALISAGLDPSRVGTLHETRP